MSKSARGPIELTIGELSEEGEGRALSPDGRMVHVRGALPGERVRVDAVRPGRVPRAALLAVLTASPDRVEAPCAVVARCGGCPLMIASAAAQVEAKRARVAAALAEVAPGIEIAIDTPHDRLAYRRRARLAFEGGRIGYRGAAQHEVIDVDACVVLEPALAAALQTLRARVAPLLVGKGELKLGRAAGGATARIDATEAQPAGLYAALDAAVREGALAGAALWAGGASAPARFGVEHEEARDVDGRALIAPLGGFGQAHGAHNHALVSLALAWLAPEGQRVLELYAGHGNFSVPIAARATSLVAVELDGPASRCLEANLARHGLVAQVIAAEAGPAAARIKRGTVDRVLLDPPREGAREAIAPLVALRPERIVYVSCRPESLAADLGRLTAGGYHVTAARALDMFPQTAHVETVVRLDRR
jgi:23S rRNA (uracil1939-C5)-methyltransferase